MVSADAQIDQRDPYAFHARKHQEYEDVYTALGICLLCESVTLADDVVFPLHGIVAYPKALVLCYYCGCLHFGATSQTYLDRDGTSHVVGDHSVPLRGTFSSAGLLEMGILTLSEAVDCADVDKAKEIGKVGGKLCGEG